MTVSSENRLLSLARQGAAAVTQVEDAPFEECDDGDNLGGYNGCNPDCTLGPSCGDGIRQPSLGEDCDADAGDGVPGSGCSASCELEVQ